MTDSTTAFTTPDAQQSITALNAIQDDLNEQDNVQESIVITDDDEHFLVVMTDDRGLMMTDINATVVKTHYNNITDTIEHWLTWTGIDDEQAEIPMTDGGSAVAQSTIETALDGSEPDQSDVYGDILPDDKDETVNSGNTPQSVGVKQMGKHRKYTSAELIDQLKESLYRYNTTDKQFFNANPDFASSSTVIARFGSWEQALHAAAISPDDESEIKNRKIPTKELIEQLRFCHSEHYPVSWTSFDENPHTASAATINTRFGDWNQALYVANISDKGN